MNALDKQYVKAKLILDFPGLFPITETTDIDHILYRYGSWGLDGELTREQVFEAVYDEIPEKQRYDCTISVWMSSPVPPKSLVRYIRKAKALRPYSVVSALKEHIDNDGFITVYRGCFQTDPGKCISWSLSKKVAEDFANKHRILHPATAVYKGQIHIDDVIGYTNDREEQEILQYGCVQGITKML